MIMFGQVMNITMPGLETSKHERRGSRTGQNKTRYQKARKNHDDNNDHVIDDDGDDDETEQQGMHPRVHDASQGNENSLQIRLFQLAHCAASKMHQ